MTERPILFSAPMVRAILDGTKTQTRRVVKPAHKAWIEMPVTHQLGEWDKRPLPYGKTGDRLWVRETWAAPHSEDARPPRAIQCDQMRIHYAASEDRGGLLWRPSIHMPRWASRITLEVTGVRVERLQDISEADAIAEGIEPTMPNPGHWNWRDYLIEGGQTHAVLSYKTLWESINGPGSWDLNPLVWVVEFKRVPEC